MSFRVSAIERGEAVTVVRVVPCSDRGELADIIHLWSDLERDPATLAVAVVPQHSDFSVALPTDAPDLLVVGPKSLGLLKPFGVGVRGQVYDYGLQLVGDADAVLAAGDARFADTSVATGLPAVHASWLRGSLPDAEINRLALLGASDAMTAVRALELGLVDEIVEVSRLEDRLMQRLATYVAR